MTVSNIIVPLIVYLDRFLIGALVSAAAITFYATPYEIATKLLLIPGSLTGVLFPAFSASYLNNPDFAKKLLIRGVKYTFILVYPIILLIITFANEGMSLWLGKKFAENSTLVLQLLAAGVLFNSIAYIPFTFLQGIRKPDIPAKIHLMEFPVYLLAMWIAIKYEGINGAAFVWVLRTIIDMLILFLLTKKEISAQFKFSFWLSCLFLLGIFVSLVFPALMIDLGIKFALVSIILLIFSYLSWKHLLLVDEKIFLISRIKLLHI